ncbi:MAG TPA: GDYXXLXY domain-containing protein [Ornithinibacter sp.]|nr:GDYXXLXY domain-containing protein [Ornithinibacter sp.]
MSTTTSRAVRVGAVVLAQLALVGVAVWAPLSARLTGEEVVLRVEPVDPIDPFRGAYVELAYPDLPQLTFPGEITQEQQEALDAERGTAFVPLTRRGEVWVGGPVQRSAPAEGLYLTCDDSSWRLECGIESWFLPQDEAAGLQDAIRGGSAVATVMVDAAGHAALVGVTTR